MRLLEKVEPHKWQATTKAKSSCHAILIPDCPSCWWALHLPLNHWEDRIPPKPMEPEASVYRCSESELVQEVDKKKLAPFQPEINSCHIFRSLKKPEVNLIWWWGWKTLRVNSTCSTEWSCCSRKEYSYVCISFSAAEPKSRWVLRHQRYERKTCSRDELAPLSLNRNQCS